MANGGKVVNMAYSKGQLTGILGRENIMVGDILLEGQDFIEGTIPDENLKEVVFDGIMGLGFPRQAVEGTTTVWENMVNKRLIPYNIFSFLLRSYNGDGNKEDPNGGYIVFGGWDPTHFKGQHIYVPVMTRPWKDFWKFKMSRIYVGRTKTEICVEECTAILDTGNTDILGPKKDINEINEAIGARNGIVSCSKVEKLPTIAFTIGGNLLPLGSRDYIAKDGGICFSRFAVISGKRWVLGEAFMRPYHTVFDYQDAKNPRIGFASAA
ncbi:hypothetical protein AALP_AA2G117500 [Arabis alpina]|uniref:Peptidase A1 domain-containing protein n=1 Tax=Arabis alpina TaxID=50452 RepID=A0A087HGT7_ARAAL|nr:hypothetical protein AALP_AA2G117500 [Arabis alpina]